MERDWARLGRELAAARKKAGLTQVDVADRIGVSRTPIQAIERGDPFEKVTSTIRLYAQLVDWIPGSVEAVLDGSSPVTTAEAQKHIVPEQGPVEDLPLRISEEISEGRLLDTAVMDLTPYGSNARMIVVVRGAPDASPEEMRRDLLAWRRAQRHLQEIGDSDDDGPAENTASQA
jgi:DNA-binding XRE family transcriptional regulator